MSSAQVLGGTSSCGRVLGSSFDKIIKNAAWRKDSNLVASCKSVLDKLETLSDSSPHDPNSPLFGVTAPDAEYLLRPLSMALDSGNAKIVEHALECSFKLLSLGLFRGEITVNNRTVLYKLIDGVCKVGGIGEESIELAILRVLLSSVRSPYVLIRGDCLVHIVRTCYNVYLGGLNGTNQICAKSVLSQIMLIVFTRVEQDSMNVTIKTICVNELMEFADKNLNEGNSVHFCQNFLNEVMSAKEGYAHGNLTIHIPASTKTHENVDINADKGHIDAIDGELDRGGEPCTGSGIAVVSKIREDGFLLFRNLCKLSMKFSSQDASDDQILLRGKILSLELLKVIMDNAESIWLTNERFLNAIKQYLCLSLLKNSALSVMVIFQLQCSIFRSLLSKFRSGLKPEIGIFFPMLVLRVLENVNQPSFLQKMTVLNFLERISHDSQLIIDIFVNYDCDVEAPNIYERVVNGLLKTALGPPVGSATTLSTAHDITFRLESVKCLVCIIRSMEAWMDQQLRIRDSYSFRGSEIDNLSENQSTPRPEDGTVPDFDLHSEITNELSDATTLEQRRTYKIEIQKGISLFNRKPSKGIEFLIQSRKIAGSPEDVAAFLKSTAGLNENMIGDYLGERDEFSLRVMHAYVNSFNFKGMDFGEAIRFFLRGFRLPGEAQKIDRIMEKFAERYCTCNPSSFSSADTAYVLAYSVIMLNTDAHNNMVKDKMTKADFIRNNRGIDDGKDIPEEYLGSLYQQIVKNEIKMNANSSIPQSKQGNSLNKLLGFDGILNLVSWKQTEEKSLGANGLLVKHIQEQFKAKSGKSESVYHVVTDVTILRFMMEACWGPMLAAFSVTLDQSGDRHATTQCLMGFRHAVHITAVMGMQTQRDAFVTSMAKFTYLHCAADMKQKNIEAVKAIISIAIEDGNFLNESWEHILTCLSRIEHLQLLGEGAPSDASFFSASSVEADEKSLKPMNYLYLKKKGTLQNPAMIAVVRGGSYDSTTIAVNSPGLVTPEQINSFIANLNLLEQIGNFELNHVFAHSQSLNSEAIVAFVKALCKVSMLELQSPTDPRVFSLTKIVEIAHYNMNRIRLVWSRIWNVLSDFFVLVGLSENLSVAIFVMDSLRQLAMKFLEREELANYNFQNEFLRPFVIVIQKSSSAEIRELIVRCISQMVLSRFNNVKSGWKSVFMVFTTAAADERKNVVLLAFETMEKIVRDFFPYITETETVTFTDCVRCLITFTNSKFNSDVSLNAIAFLRFCAVKLADGGLGCSKGKSDDDSSILANKGGSDVKAFTEKDDHRSFWLPLLAGLSKLTTDPRSAIRKSALEVLFNILKDHGHLFSCAFWVEVFSSVIFPIFNSDYSKKEMLLEDDQNSQISVSPQVDTWDPETFAVAAQYLVDLFVIYFDVVRSQMRRSVLVLAGYMRSSIQGPASTGVAAFLRLTGALGGKLSGDEWRDIFLALKDAAVSTIPSLMKVLTSIDGNALSDRGLSNDDLEDDHTQTATYAVSRLKSHIAVQLLIVQVVTDLYKRHLHLLSSQNTALILDVFSSIARHARELNSKSHELKKLHSACSILELSHPPTVHFENESLQKFLDFLQDLLVVDSPVYKEINLGVQLVTVCEQILEIYIECTKAGQQKAVNNQPVAHWILPLGLAKKEEMVARTSLLVSALRALSSMDQYTFKRYALRFFPLLVDLVRSEHCSREVLCVLSNVFQSCIGPLIIVE